MKGILSILLIATMTLCLSNVAVARDKGSPPAIEKLMTLTAVEFIADAPVMQ